MTEEELVHLLRMRDQRMAREAGKSTETKVVSEASLFEQMGITPRQIPQRPH